MARKDKCRYCGGTLAKEDGSFSCLSCGRTHLTNRQVHKFAQEHKVEIFHDAVIFGYKFTREKYGIGDFSINLVVQELKEKEREWLIKNKPDQYRGYLKLHE